MKIIVLHGDHVVDSYNRLQKLKEEGRRRGWEIKTISDNLANIPEELVSVGLFEKERLTIIDSINLIRKKDILWLNKNAGNLKGTLIIYQAGRVSSLLIKSLSPDKIEEFKLPKLIWMFLDTLTPGNAGNSLMLLHKIIKSQPSELVLALLGRHLRDLYWAKETSDLPYPSWRIGKLKRQAARFTKDLLADLIASLAEADVRSKTSKEELIDSLDFIIATKLE